MSLGDKLNRILIWGGLVGSMAGFGSGIYNNGYKDALIDRYNPQIIRVIGSGKFGFFYNESDKKIYDKLMEDSRVVQDFREIKEGEYCCNRGMFVGTLSLIGCLVGLAGQMTKKESIIRERNEFNDSFNAETEERYLDPPKFKEDEED